MRSVTPGSRRLTILLPMLATALWLSVPTAYGQELPAPTQNAVAGAAVFGEKGCIRCHSISGGGQRAASSLCALRSRCQNFTLR